MQAPDACVIISAPSGAGKTTLVRHLLRELPNLAFSISATSRPQRANELDGVDYHFLSGDAFRERVAAGELLEWEEVYPGRYYGTLRSELARIREAGGTPIFDVDVVGGLRLKTIFGDRALALFIAPPSMAVLEERLRKRNTETPESLKARVDKAEQECGFAPRFDATVINDDLERASAEILERVRSFLAP